MSKRLLSLLRITLPVLAAGLLGSCGQPRASSVPVPTGCPLVAAADSTDSAWPLSIAMGPDLYPVVLSEPGFPGTRPQRFTTHQVSETLIRLDCRGDAVAGLASTWTVDSSGHFCGQGRPAVNESTGSEARAQPPQRSAQVS